MLSVLLRRLLVGIPMLFVVTIIMFLLSSLVPGDQARQILGEYATPEAVAALREQLGLNLPLYQQYWNWAADAMRGDLGRSIYSGEPVVEMLNDRVPVTASIVLFSTLVIAVVGATLGLLSAFRGGWLGRALDVFSLIGLAVPSFAVAVLLVALFAVTIRIFPATGFVDPTDSVGGWLMSLVLPVAAASLTGVTLVAKQMRDSTLDALTRDYVRVLRANGMRERSILFRHVLKNAAVPSVTILGIGAIASLTSTVFIENVFVLPGLGTVATQATLTHDLPVVLGLGVYFTVIAIAINFVVDAAYGMLNPKVRVS
jgi:peptide/nickel transport system permease protein